MRRAGRWVIAVPVGVLAGALAACSLPPTQTQLDQDQYSWALALAQESLPLATEVTVDNQPCGPEVNDEPCSNEIFISASFRNYGDILASEAAMRELDDAIGRHDSNFDTFIWAVDQEAAQRDAEVARSIASAVHGLAGAWVHTGAYGVRDGEFAGTEASLVLYVDDPRDVTIQQMGEAASVARDGLVAREAVVTFMEYLPADALDLDPDAADTWNLSISPSEMTNLGDSPEDTCFKNNEWAFEHEVLGFRVLTADAPNACRE